MKLNLKYILIVAVVIIVLITIFSFTTPEESKEDLAKKNEINSMFAIWTNVVGAGDKVTLLRNEVPVKKDLFEKLNTQELVSLKTYSLALQDMLKAKSTPWNATFLNALTYLTTNFVAAKAIISKTSAANIFDGFGLGSTTPVSKSESGFKSFGGNATQLGLGDKTCQANAIINFVRRVVADSDLRMKNYVDMEFVKRPMAPGVMTAPVTYIDDNNLITNFKNC